MYEPDFTSRYFAEDFAYGLRFVGETANSLSVNIPIIREIYNWGTYRYNINE